MSGPRDFHHIVVVNGKKTKILYFDESAWYEYCRHIIDIKGGVIDERSGQSSKPLQHEQD